VKPAAPLADQIHEQVTSQLGQLQQVGRVEAQLNLHPPELGRVQVHLALADGRLNVRMLVQDDNAKRAIDQQLEPLRVRFAEMGVSVGQFDVRRDGNSANAEQQQAAEPSAQALQPDSAAAADAQKSYAKFVNADALVDVIA
jgi:flagellar hook-length control protein FliK